MVTATSRRVLEFTQKIYLGILATVYPSGGPQAFPVWYEYDGDSFYITTVADTAKVRNLAGNPNVALCITDTSRQIRSLTVLGRAEVTMDNLRPRSCTAACPSDTWAPRKAASGPTPWPMKRWPSFASHPGDSCGPDDQCLAGV